MITKTAYYPPQEIPAIEDIHDIKLYEIADQPGVIYAEYILHDGSTTFWMRELNRTLTPIPAIPSQAAEYTPDWEK